MADDVGAALVGPFDKFLSPYDLMRRRTDIEDREGEEWPTANLRRDVEALPQSPTMPAFVDALMRREADIPPITSRFQQEAGTGDVGPVGPEELLKFIIDVDRLNPPVAPSVPLPGSIPLPRRRPDNAR